jgi:hypothetical protein
MSPARQEQLESARKLLIFGKAFIYSRMLAPMGILLNVLLVRGSLQTLVENLLPSWNLVNQMPSTMLLILMVLEEFSFQSFSRALNPRFPMRRSVLDRDAMDLYKREKNTLHSIMSQASGH